jgi:hypothetical protein
MHMESRAVESKEPAVEFHGGRPVLNTDQEGVAVREVSPTGAPVIPPHMVPWFLAGAGVLQIVGDEVSDPRPWSGARVIGLGVKLVSFLALGASPGLRRR